MEKGSSGRGRCADYNLNHMDDLKKTLSLSCNHGFKDLPIFCKLGWSKFLCKFWVFIKDFPIQDL